MICTHECNYNDMLCPICEQEATDRLIAEIARLRAALDTCMVGGNHIATYRTDRWPEPGTAYDLALMALGAGREYDMWCCWNAIMQARDIVNQQKRSDAFVESVNAKSQKD